MKPETKGVAGHEGAGTVVAVGDDMHHKWKVGDRAVSYLCPQKPVSFRDRTFLSLLSTTVYAYEHPQGIKWVWSTCGICEFCTNGIDELHCPQQKNSGFSAAGTFQEYALSDGRYTTRIPEGVADEEAGPIMCGGVTAYTACKRSAVKPGQWIVRSRIPVLPSDHC